MNLSIVIPTFNEASNIVTLLDKIKEIFEFSDIDYEIIVVDAGSRDNTFQIAKDKGVKVIIQKKPGYGGALNDAFKLAKGKYIITMDADFSHNPYIIKRLFSIRNSAHIIIASRYIRGGLANMPLLRMILSIALNRFLCFGLSLPLRDLSSGFRLYNSEIFKEIDFSGTNFDVCVEILVKAYMRGFTVKEIPFHYQPRTKGSSHARVFKFGVDFLRTFFKMWKIRNTITSADYDDRAFHSRIPMQRFWQRQRYKIICGFVGHRKNVLDVGCGTSKILAALPQAIGFDLNFNKLRYNLFLGNNLINGDIKNICFKDESFDVVICSEVIEHIERDYQFFQELTRILKKNGILILGTPDYSTFSWNIIEWLYKRIVPGGYADEHITRYNRKELVRLMENIDFKLQDYKYILGAELICKFVRAS